MYKIFDLHNDYYLKILSDEKKNKYISKNVNAENIISAVWTSELNIDESISQIEKARSYINKNKKLFLSVEDLHFLSKTNLDRFLSMRPVYAGLTWNTTNCIAGGAHESGNLTNFGKHVIKRLEENNIKVDSAHLNEQSFMDLARVATKPIFCSHTAFFGLQPHSRNLKDYQIKMIIDSGGIIGLCLVSDFINGTKRCAIKDIAGQIDYFACKFGIDNLAIGTDFYGTSHLPRHLKNYAELATNLPKILEKMGYTEKSINKIFYDNAYRFFLA